MLIGRYVICTYPKGEWISLSTKMVLLVSDGFTSTHGDSTPSRPKSQKELKFKKKKKK